MDLYEKLTEKAVSGKTFLALTGGGGKTTLMIRLAAHLKAKGLKVLMTTTTKIMSPRVMDYGADLVFSDDSVMDYSSDGPCVVLYALEDRTTNKWHCPPIENLRALMGRYDVIIDEADGSRHLPVKVHTQRDPVVPDFCSYTISVMGLWAIGRRTTEIAFGDERDVLVDRGYLQWHLDDPQGLLKGSIPGSRAIVFNGAEDFHDVDILRSLRYPDDVFVCTASESKGELYETIQ